MGKLIGLVDCNNFFVSCERLFEPKWEGRPVGVLSNNDGCFIARSNELKGLGVKMGQPYHEVAHLVKEHGVIVRSGNFHLYSDISNRIMRILRDRFCVVEAYSIDEGFVELEGIEEAMAARELIRKWVGIPTSFGIARTKVLAKVACGCVKRGGGRGGCMELVEGVDEVLRDLPVGDIWGIGRKKGIFLETHGISTALDFKQADRGWVRRHLSVTGERLQMELGGVSCMGMVEEEKDKQSIMRSRSFGRVVKEKEELMESVAQHAFDVARDLRSQGGVACGIGVFIRTNPHVLKAQYSNSVAYYFEEGTDMSGDFVQAARGCLEGIYREGYEYAKSGVYLLKILPKRGAQLDLFRGEVDEGRAGMLNKAMDDIYMKYGAGGLYMGTMGGGGGGKGRGKWYRRIIRDRGMS